MTKLTVAALQLSLTDDMTANIAAVSDLVREAVEQAERIAREHNIRVVFVTANPGQISPPSGGIGYVRKPFNEAAILAAAAEAAVRSAAPAA